MKELLTKKSAISIAVAIATLATAVPVVAMDFTFSFTDFEQGENQVTGIIRGLQDNATSAATSVEVTSNTGGFGVGEYVGNPSDNSFTVMGGDIVSAFFTSFGSNNVSPAVTCCSLDFSNLDVGSLPLIIAGLSPDPDTVIISNNSVVTFTPLTPPETIPEPTSVLGFIVLGGYFLASRRKKESI